MKALLAILFITLLALTGNPHMIVQKQIPASKNTVIIQNIYNDSLRLSSDEKKKMYYVEVKKTENLTNQLIAKTANLEAENLRLVAEIKRSIHPALSFRRKLASFLLNDKNFIKI